MSKTRYEYKVVVPTSHNMNEAALEGFRVVPGVYAPNGNRAEVIMEREVPCDTNGAALLEYDTESEVTIDRSGKVNLYTIGEAAWLEPEAVEIHLPPYLKERLITDEVSVMTDIATLMSGYLTMGRFQERLIADAAGAEGYRSYFGLALEEACIHYVNDNPPTQALGGRA